MKTITVCPGCKKLNRFEVSSAEVETPVCGQCGSPLICNGGVTELTVTNIGTLTQKCPMPVVVLFYTPDNGAYLNFNSTFIGVARQKVGKLAFARIDISKSNDVKEGYRISAIPTTAVYYRGMEQARFKGSMAGPALITWLEGIQAA